MKIKTCASDYFFTQLSQQIAYINIEKFNIKLSILKIFFLLLNKRVVYALYYISYKLYKSLNY
jgi:hypothetical protein